MVSEPKTEVGSEVGGEVKVDIEGHTNKVCVATVTSNEKEYEDKQGHNVSGHTNKAFEATVTSLDKEKEANGSSNCDDQQNCINNTKLVRVNIVLFYQIRAGAFMYYYVRTYVHGSSTRTTIRSCLISSVPIMVLASIY